MSDWYEVLKAAHLIAVIAWMAGIFYLPRLFVYHRDAAPGGELSETFKIMERRLLNAIMLPAGTAVWVFGLLLAVALGGVPPWLWVKIGFAAAMTGFHVWLDRMTQRFAGDARPHSSRFFRTMNEVPTVLLIAIVVLAVLKPF